MKCPALRSAHPVAYFETRTKTRNTLLSNEHMNINRVPSRTLGKVGLGRCNDTTSSICQVQTGINIVTFNYMKTCESLFVSFCICAVLTFVFVSTCFCIFAVLASIFVLCLLLYLCAAAGKCRKFRLGEGQLTTQAPTSTTW